MRVAFPFVDHPMLPVPWRVVRPVYHYELMLLPVTHHRDSGNQPDLNAALPNPAPLDAYRWHCWCDEAFYANDGAHPDS